MDIIRKEYEAQCLPVQIPKMDIYDYLTEIGRREMIYNEETGLYTKNPLTWQEEIASNLKQPLNPPKSSCVMAININVKRPNKYTGKPVTYTGLDGFISALLYMIKTNGINIIDCWILRDFFEEKFDKIDSFIWRIVNDIKHAEHYTGWCALRGSCDETIMKQEGTKRCIIVSPRGIKRVNEDDLCVASLSAVYTPTYGYGAHPLIPELFTPCHYYGFLYGLRRTIHGGRRFYVKYDNTNKSIILRILDYIFGDILMITKNVNHLFDKQRVSCSYNLVRDKTAYVIAYLADKNDTPKGPKCKYTNLGNSSCMTGQIILNTKPLDKLKSVLSKCLKKPVENRCINHFHRRGRQYHKFIYSELSPLNNLEGVAPNDIRIVAQMIASHLASIGAPDAGCSVPAKKKFPITDADNETVTFM